MKMPVLRERSDVDDACAAATEGGFLRKMLQRRRARLQAVAVLLASRLVALTTTDAERTQATSPHMS